MEYDKLLEFLNKGLYEQLFISKIDNLKSQIKLILISKADIQ